MIEQREKEDLIENKMRLYYLLREIQKESDLYKEDTLALQFLEKMKAHKKETY